MQTLLAMVGWTCLAFSCIGFVELGVAFWKTEGYNLMRAIIYCSLFGIGLGILKH